MGGSLGVLFIDLDGLKETNDRFGHRAGDEALQAIARIIREQTRPTDVAARVGGDEFCLLMGEATPEILANVAARIDAAIDGRNRDSGTPYDVAVSVGSFLADPRSPGTINDLIEQADSTMYQRKARRAS